MLKRLMAMVLALVLCLTMFVGCSKDEAASNDTTTPVAAVVDYDAAFAKYDPDTVVMTVDGTEVTWSEFFFMLYSSMSQIESYMGGIYWDELCLGDMTFDAYAMDMTLTMLKQLHAVEREAKELNVKLSDAEQAAIAESRETVKLQNIGADATDEDLEQFLLDEIFLTTELFNFVNENSYLYEKLFVEVMGESGEKITDEQVQDFIESVPYISAKHILIMTVNPENGEKLSDAVIQESKNTAEGLLAQLLEIKDVQKRAKKFDQLMIEHTEDTGIQIFPDGYTFTYNQMYPVFEEAAFALEEYEISGIVESEAGYHILMRIPTTRDSLVDYDSTYGTFYSVLAYASTELYSQMLSDWMAECEVEWKAEFKDITAKELFE